MAMAPEHRGLSVPQDPASGLLSSPGPSLSALLLPPPCWASLTNSLEASVRMEAIQRICSLLSGEGGSYI